MCNNLDDELRCKRQSEAMNYWWQGLSYILCCYRNSSVLLKLELNYHLTHFLFFLLSFSHDSSLLTQQQVTHTNMSFTGRLCSVSQFFEE